MRTSIRRIVDRRAVFAALGACAAFGVLPVIVGLVLSFCDVEQNGTMRFGSIDGYTAVLSGGRLHEVSRIAQRALISTLTAMLLSVPAAYAIARIPRASVKRFFIGALVAPWLVSDMLRAFGWQLLLSPTGPISMLWTTLSGAEPLEGLRYNWVAVTVGLVSASLPAGVLSVLAALPQHDDPEWLAASELGDERHMFWLFAVRRARYGILVGACAVFVLSCFASAEARFLDGPTQSSIQTVTSSLVNDGVPALAAFGSLLVGTMILICAGAFGVRRLLKAGPLRLQVPLESMPAPLRSAGRPRGEAGVVVNNVVRVLPRSTLALVLLLCVAPIAAVTAEAFREPTLAGSAWTLENFRRMMASSTLVDALTNSWQIALAVAVVAVLIGFCLSITVWDLAIRRWVLLLLPTLVFLPGDAYAISLYQLARLFGQRQGSELLVVVAHALWAIPFATGTLALANMAIRTNILEAGLEYARSPVEVLVRIIGRLNGGRIVAVAFLAATLSLNEYVRASYLAGGVLTLGSEVYGRLNAGLLPENRGVFAAAVLMFGLSLASTALTIRLVRGEEAPN